MPCATVLVTAMFEGTIQSEIRTVDGVEVEELLDFLSYLCWRVIGRIVVWFAFAVNTPVVHKTLEHAKGAEFVELAQPAKNGQLLVCHAHVYFMSVLVDWELFNKKV